MSVITRVPEPKLWDTICKEFESRRAPERDDDEASVHTDYQDYDPSHANPVFYGKMHAKTAAEDSAASEVDVGTSHPACVGYAFVDKPPPSPRPPSPSPPDKKTCTPREFLEHYVFPTLLPVLESMLEKAREEKCFERKRTRFNALDYLTEKLYQNNPEHSSKERVTTELTEIPFVKEWLVDHPRPPLPKSLVWTEEEAALKIQSFYRGYRARLDPEIQELREWQRKWREDNRGIRSQVQEFWAEKMPAAETSPRASQDVLTHEDSQSAAVSQSKHKSPSQSPTNTTSQD